MNATFRERGVRVSIFGWEEVQPEAGRPQELINPLVYECEIFVGLLNMRWGSETGTHSSGFEEEFEIALARRSEGLNPAIGMFFREVAKERLDDLGPQLIAVLEFQERIRRDRLALYKFFKNADHLALEIYDFLTPYALQLVHEVGSKAPDGATMSGATPAAGEPIEMASSSEIAEPAGAEKSVNPTGRHEIDSAQRQILEAFKEFSGMFTGDGTPSEAARDRVALVGTAFTKDHGLLGTHHVNRLYKERAQLDLTMGEAREWYRTYFANVGTAKRSERTIPIWGLIDVSDIKDRFDSELGSLVQDDDDSIARGVLRFLTTNSIRPKALWDSDECEGSAGGSEVSRTDEETFEETVQRWSALFEHFPVVEVALNYLTELATVEDIPLLTAIAAEGTIDEDSRRAVTALARTMSGDFSSTDDLAPGKYQSDTAAVRGLLVDSMPALDSSQWDVLLSGTQKDVSIAAAVQLVQHDEVTDQQLKSAIELESPTVEAAVVERGARDLDWAVAKIAKLAEIDKYATAHLVCRLLAASSPPGLLDDLGAKETFTVSCWIARTIQDPSGYLEAAREVLDGEAEFLNDRVAPLLADYRSIAQHMTASAKAAACGVLADEVNAQRVGYHDLIRVADELRRDHYLSRRPASQALVKMTARLARPFPRLSDLSAFDTYQAILECETILASPFAEFVVPVWRKSSIPQLQTAAQTWELRQEETADAVLEEALYVDDGTVRMAAMDQLLARWSNEQLTDLLNRYDKQSRPYWYNIIAALDEHLYGYASSMIDAPE